MRKIAVILATLLLFPLMAFAVEDNAGNPGGNDPGAGGNAADTASPPPSTEPAYQYQRQGIFDCNQSGAYAMSIGSRVAAAGAYVPVADATVEDNTGILVYKECILREIVDRERESAMTGFSIPAYNAVTKGREGNPQYVVDGATEETLNARDPALLATLHDTNLWNNVPAEMRTQQQRALAQRYETGRAGSIASVKCPYSGSLQAFRSGQAYNASTFLSDFWNASAPQCDDIIESVLIQDIADARIATAVQSLRDQWDWGNGFYARVDASGNIITPSIITQQLFSQILQSPLRQLESANDIGQMIGAVYGGLSTRILSNQSGLAGLSSSVGGQLSYLDQIARESGAGLRNAAANAALRMLGAQQQLDAAIYQALSNIITSLTQTQTQLRAAETQCWTTIITKVCASTPTGGTCTGINGNQLKIATSTAFSDAVINAQITPSSVPAQAAVNDEQTVLQVIQSLIQGVSNTASLSTQSAAIEQVDKLTTSGYWHRQSDLTQAQQKQSAVADQMSKLLTTTAQVWGGTGSDPSTPANIPWDGTTNPGVGWCNTGNSATIQAWAQTWKQ